MKRWFSGLSLFSGLGLVRQSCGGANSATLSSPRSSSILESGRQRSPTLMLFGSPLVWLLRSSLFASSAIAWFSLTPAATFLPTWLNRARLLDRPRSGEFARPSLAGEADLGASASTISAGQAGVDLSLQRVDGPNHQKLQRGKKGPAILFSHNLRTCSGGTLRWLLKDQRNSFLTSLRVALFLVCEVRKGRY